MVRRWTKNQLGQASSDSSYEKVIEVLSIWLASVLFSIQNLHFCVHELLVTVLMWWNHTFPRHTDTRYDTSSRPSAITRSFLESPQKEGISQSHTPHPPPPPPPIVVVYSDAKFYRLISSRKTFLA